MNTVDDIVDCGRT